MPFLTKSRVKPKIKTLNDKKVAPIENDDSNKEILNSNVEIAVSEDGHVDSLNETKKNLEKSLEQKEEMLRRLKLVKSYKSRVIKKMKKLK